MKMEYGQWLDIFWDAVRRTGYKGIIYFSFTEQHFLAGHGPLESVEEFLEYIK